MCQHDETIHTRIVTRESGNKAKVTSAWLNMLSQKPKRLNKGVPNLIMTKMTIFRTLSKTVKAQFSNLDFKIQDSF
jgi:hypothetical protein